MARERLGGEPPEAPGVEPSAHAEEGEGRALLLEQKARPPVLERAAEGPEGRAKDGQPHRNELVKVGKYKRPSRNPARAVSPSPRT